MLLSPIPMGDRIQVIVSARQGADLAELASRLRAAGMEVVDVLDQVGVVCGSVLPGRLSSLSAVEGVGHVEESREFQLAPPDSEIQ